MIENLIKRIEKEYKYGSKFKLSLAEMFFYVKWFGKIVYSNFFLENHSFFKKLWIWVNGHTVEASFEIA